jgi:hypothetical protein
LICSIKPPASLNEEASSFLAKAAMVFHEMTNSLARQRLMFGHYLLRMKKERLLFKAGTKT